MQKGGEKMKIEKSKYTHRFVARVVIEAETPMAVGSGEKDILTDALVVTDANGLPYIPGTSIAGVLRSMIGEEEASKFFGTQDNGSEIIFSDARIVASDGMVVDGLRPDAMDTDSLLRHYRQLPIRQHVRIGSKGTGEDRAKFDEQVVFAGTRFCFEIEMVATSDDEVLFNSTLNCIGNKTFRLGHGSRKGFGSISVKEIKRLMFDLTKENDREGYLQLTSYLNDKKWGDVEKDQDKKPDTSWDVYHLELRPLDFMFFGSGFGDGEADMTPVKENKVVWENGHGHMEEKLTLIPASSIKGALSHRVAYHYNKKNGLFVDNPEAKAGGENAAVRTLFGCTLDKGNVIERGNVLFSDIIAKTNAQDVVLHHVAIDRFTGGALDGALFQEKPTFAQGEVFETEILVNNAVVTDSVVIESLEAALIDIVECRLPLGGSVNRGNGMFEGKVTKNGEMLYESK